MKRSILVTGGAGFIGSHLCRHLLAGGHEIVCEMLSWTPEVPRAAGLTKTIDCFRVRVGARY